MKRVYNFSPGPAMLPEAVLRRAQAELLDWQDSGMSVMEVSHRGTAFIEFAARSEKNLRALLGVPDSLPVVVLNVAQAGLLVMLNASGLPSGSLAVGVKA